MNNVLILNPSYIYLFISNLVNIAFFPGLLLAIILPFKSYRGLRVQYFSICMTSSLIGYFASNSRISGGPELSAGILGIISTVFLYKSVINDDFKKLKSQFLILLSISISVYAGSSVGAFVREKHEDNKYYTQKNGGGIVTTPTLQAPKHHHEFKNEKIDKDDNSEKGLNVPGE